MVLGWIAFAWVLGVATGAWGFAGGGIVLGAGALMGSVALAGFGGTLSARLWVLPLTGLACCAGLGMAHPPRPACTNQGAITATATVDRLRFGTEEADVWLRVVEGRWQESSSRIVSGTRIRLRTALGAAPPYGSRVTFQGSARPPTILRNRSLKPWRTRRRDGACWATGTIDVESNPSVGSSVARVRDRIRGRLIEGLPSDTASVARALTLGDGAALPYERRRTIATVGLAHLFAVSGLHIALISGTLVRLIAWALQGVCVGVAPIRVAAALGVPLALLHAAFAGGAPSAWRAAVTAAITWSFVALGRKAAATSVMGAAVLVLSAPEPGLATRPAFLLSIVATAAILGGNQVSAGRWRRIRMASSISARTLVATTPLVWWWFGGVPLIGWLSNIVLLPLGSLIVIPLAHLYALLGGFRTVGAWLGASLDLAVGLLFKACDYLAPFAVARHLPPLDALQGCIVAAGCAAVLAANGWRHRSVVLACAALAWGGAELRIVDRMQPEGTLRISFMDVGQGDAALVDFPDGSLGLIDTGPGGSHPAGRELALALRERRRTRIDRVIITHGHPDHDGGLSDLLDETEVGELWLNGQRLAEERDGSLRALLAAARRKGVHVRFVRELCNAPHVFGGATLEVLWPCPRYDPALDLNDNSITLLVSFGVRRALMMGDLEAAAETELIARRLVPAIDVLKVGHHGSITSSTSTFIEQAAPAFAVISVGRHNRYGHPHPDVLARLEAVGAHVLRTDTVGGVEIETDGQRLGVRTWREEVDGRP